jgi:hypothetical protein
VLLEVIQPFPMFSEAFLHAARDVGGRLTARPRPAGVAIGF